MSSGYQQLSEPQPEGTFQNPPPSVPAASGVVVGPSPGPVPPASDYPGVRAPLPGEGEQLPLAYNQQQPVFFQPNQPFYGQPYYAPAVQVMPSGPLYRSPVFRIGEEGHLVPGIWSDGIFDCFDAMGICVLSWCVVPLRFAITMSRLSFMTMISALLLYGLPWLALYICDTVFNITLNYLWLIGAALGNALMIAIGTWGRIKIREKYQIPGNECEDCVLHSFCRCCAIAQEARHVDRDFAIPI